MDFSELKGKLVYLSNPYTHEECLVREVRFLEVIKATAWLFNNLRLNIFSPIIITHPILVRYTMPVEWEFWAEYDTAVIAACAELWVLCTPGWTNSMGVHAERKIALDMGRRVRYMIPCANGEKPYIITDVEPSEQELYGKVEPGRLGVVPAVKV